MIAVFLAAALAASPVESKGISGSPPRSQAETLKDWALARCIARGASGAFAYDAAISTAALLERGDYGIETYTAVDTLVGQQLKSGTAARYRAITSR